MDWEEKAKWIIAGFVVLYILGCIFDFFMYILPVYLFVILICCLFSVVKDFFGFFSGIFCKDKKRTSSSCFNEDKRFNKNIDLAEKISNNIGVPIHKFYIQDYNYEEWNEVLIKGENINESLTNAKISDIEFVKNEIINFRLSVLFDCRSLCMPIDNAFENREGNIYSMHKSGPFYEVNEIYKKYHNIMCRSLPLSDDASIIIEELQSKCQTIQSLDVAGSFTTYDLEKLSEQTIQYATLYDKAKIEIESVFGVIPELNDVLQYVRTVAFDNIQLCIKLLKKLAKMNGRGNVGGDSLKIQTDQICVQIQECLNDIKTSDLFASNYFEKHLAEIASSDFSKKIGGMFVDKVIKDPKTLMNHKSMGTAAAVAVGAIALSALSARNDAIIENNRQQKQYIKAIKNLLDEYIQCSAQVGRVIEIIKSIVKSNTGFMYIYKRVHKKVYEENSNDSELMQEMYDLVGAIKAFKKISDSKIKE